MHLTCSEVLCNYQFSTWTSVAKIYAVGLIETVKTREALNNTYLHIVSNTIA